VTLSDPKAPTRKMPSASGLARNADTATRSVRLSGLPDLKLEQEPLLQQAIEKLVDKVVRVTVINETHEAIAELENPADASKLALIESMLFQSCTITFSEEITHKPAKRTAKQVSMKAPLPKAKLALSPAASYSPSSSVPFIPRATKVRRGGVTQRGLGDTQGASPNAI